MFCLDNKEYIFMVFIQFFQIHSYTNVTTQHWVNDGCNTTGLQIVGSFQQPSYFAGVRCCSEDGNSCVTPGTCPADNMSFDDATTKCEELGKRLCTKDELVGGICCTTGGMCDSYEVWSSTPFAVCESWRQTAKCKFDGPREPKNDKPCDTKINDESGYCECTDGSRRMKKVCNSPIDLGYEYETCLDACNLDFWCTPIIEKSDFYNGMILKVVPNGRDSNSDISEGEFVHYLEKESNNEIKVKWNKTSKEYSLNEKYLHICFHRDNVSPVYTTKFTLATRTSSYGTSSKAKTKSNLIPIVGGVSALALFIGLVSLTLILIFKKKKCSTSNKQGNYSMKEENTNSNHEGYDEAEFKNDNINSSSGRNKKQNDFAVIQNPYYGDGVEYNLSGIDDSHKHEEKDSTVNVVVLQNPYYE